MSIVNIGLPPHVRDDFREPFVNLTVTVPSLGFVYLC